MKKNHGTHQLLDYIQPGEIQMKADYDRYEEYTRKRNSVNSVFD